MRALCPGALRDKRSKRKRPHQLSADAADVVVTAPHANDVVRGNSIRDAPQTAAAVAHNTTALPPPTTPPPPQVSQGATRVKVGVWLGL